MLKPTHEIVEDGRAIRCLKCGKVSYNQNDVTVRYCGFCHIFHDIQPHFDKIKRQSLLFAIAFAIFFVLNVLLAVLNIILVHWVVGLLNTGCAVLMWHDMRGNISLYRSIKSL